MFDSLEKIIKSDTFDAVVFIVVLTLISLAAAQSALLDLSDKADEVPLLNKIIGRLGLGAAAFAFFYSCLLYTSPSPRDPKTSRMPSSA